MPDKSRVKNEEINETSSLIGSSTEEDARVPATASSNKNQAKHRNKSTSNGNSYNYKSIKDILTKRSSQNADNIIQQQQLLQQQQQLIYSQLVNVINDRRSKCKQNASFIIILIVSLLERFAFYGLISNFILYLNKQPLFWESYNASIILFMFFGITYISSLIGGWVADSLIGKFTTICLSFSIYIIGYLIFPYISYDKDQIPNICSYSHTNSNKTTLTQIFSFKNYTGYYTESHRDLSKLSMTDRDLFDETCSWLIILTSISIAIGVGFIKANLGPFGADQVISRGQTMVFKYFNWLYWSINLGSLSSILVLAYIQQNYSFFIGYLIPLIALLLSFILFISGKLLIYNYSLHVIHIRRFKS